MVTRLLPAPLAPLLTSHGRTPTTEDRNARGTSPYRSPATARSAAGLRQATCRLLLALVLALASTTACVSGGDSTTAAGVILPTEAPFGPKIIFDPLALPIPEVPLPSDLLLQRTDEGDLAWNVSKRAPTGVERQIRELLPLLDGFGSFAPISVAFDAPIDLDTVHSSSVLVVDITDGADTRGEVIPLDFGEGLFPIIGGGRFWAFDPDEDLADFLLPRDNDYPYLGETQRVSHYEVETNTLILRPTIPFTAGHRYAILLTRDILGATPPADAPESGPRPIRSPFAYKAHAAQAHLVADALALSDLTSEDLAFGWAFTVGDPEKPLLDLRDGLYGTGRFAPLATDFPPTLGDIRDTGIKHDANGVDYPLDARDHRYVLQGDYLNAILSVVLGISGGFSVAFDHVDYVAFGSMPSPDVRLGPNKTFAPSASTTPTDVPWLIAVPKTTARFAPPFPVVFYFHGTGSSRFEFLALANNLARQGIATVAYDQIGHGPIVPDIKSLLAGQGLDPGQIEFFIPLLVNFLAPDRAAEFEGLGFAEAYAKMLEIGFFAELAFYGRTEDVDGDGALTSSESFFFADPFMQCAAFQQDLVDFTQFVRTLRSFSQAAVPAAIEDPANADPTRLMQNLMAGDFNADGILDLGGPDVRIGTAGTSLGGFHAFMAAAIEPEVSTTSPIAAGGGLADILLRSTLRQITRVIYLEVFGPLIIGCPDGSGGLHLSFNDESSSCRTSPATSSFAHIPSAPAGTIIRLENQANREIATYTLDTDAEGFSLSIPSDRWDELLIEVLPPNSTEPAQRIFALTPYQGLALHRNTPEFRRFVAITQHALDRCDPISFARRLLIDPIGQPKSVLFENVISDRTVPISTGISLARATGVLGDADTSAAIMDTLVAAGVMNGAAYDVDDLLKNNAATEPPLGPLPTVPSGPDGESHSAIRFAFANGRHEWIAGPTDDTEYDAHTMSRNRIAIFHATNGRLLLDDICLADESCPLLDSWTMPD